MIRFLLFLVLMLPALPALAQEPGGFRFSDDAYMAGRSVVYAGTDVDDLFASGDRVTLSGDLTGSAYVMARNVAVTGRIGNTLYAGGNNVDLRGSVADDAILMGTGVDVGGPVGGDLRVGGTRVEITANIGDSALVGAESVYLNATISGDAGFAANEVEFGPDARVGGILHLYGDTLEALDVPESVAPASRVQRHPDTEWGGFMSGAEGSRKSFGRALSDFIRSIAVIGVLASVLAAIAPDFLTAIRERALESPIRSAWLGFLTLSAAIGSAVVLGLTGIGIILIPVSVLVTLAIGLLGFLVATYVLGVGMARFAGRGWPESLGDRVIAAFIGAGSMALLGLLPFLGWVLTLVLALWGAGGLIVRWVSPGFYTEIR
ncbi:MAG TPA: hypothetical protein ENJ52_11530 [Aliiroseovarius sp.]|nr:hypothetical protein [Aliiroseovarius sp.]